MIQFMVTLKDGVRTRGEILDLEELDDVAMARIEELIIDMREHVERIARVHQARRSKGLGP